MIVNMEGTKRVVQVHIEANMAVRVENGEIVGEEEQKEGQHGAERTKDL
jgi:hypothetical protein